MELNEMSIAYSADNALIIFHVLSWLVPCITILDFASRTRDEKFQSFIEERRELCTELYW